MKKFLEIIKFLIERFSANNKVTMEKCAEHVEKELKENDIHYCIEELIICDNCECGIKEMKLNGFNHLKRIEIGNDSFEDVKSVAIMNCNELQEIITDDSSFFKTRSLTLSSIF